MGEELDSTFRHTLQVYKTLVLKAGSQGEVRCHLPRAGLVTHSPARPSQSMKAGHGDAFLLALRCVFPAQRAPPLSIQIFSILLLAFFFFLILVCLFSFHFFSFFAVSPERFDLHFGCYPLLPLTFKTLHSEVFFLPSQHFLAFYFLAAKSCLPGHARPGPPPSLHPGPKEGKTHFFF